MASFASQLIDVIYGLVERLTGYGRGEEKGAAAAGANQEPTKLASAEALRSEQVVEIRSREVSGGSGAQVN